MSENHKSSQVPGTGTISPRSLSRREFVKVASLAGAALGVGGSLGGLVAACGGEAETTTSAAGATTTTTGATTTVGGATTTVTAGAETGRAIKIGWSTPQIAGML